MDPSILALIAIGAGALWLRHRVRTHRRQLHGRVVALLEPVRGLEDLPPELQQTALWYAGQGGHEFDVLKGTRTIGNESVLTVFFGLRLHRAVRGESAVLLTAPPFRLESPTHVVSYQLPRRFGHLLIKRRGAADYVAQPSADPPRTLVAIAREASGIDRVVGVDPPAPLAGSALNLPALPSHRVWADSPALADSLLGPSITDYLESRAAGTGEWIIELLGPLMLVYLATDGELSAGELLAMNTFTDELCSRFMEASAPHSPRGLDPRR